MKPKDLVHDLALEAHQHIVMLVEVLEEVKALVLIHLMRIEADQEVGVIAEAEVVIITNFLSQICCNKNLIFCKCHALDRAQASRATIFAEITCVHFIDCCF